MKPGDSQVECITAVRLFNWNQRVMSDSTSQWWSTAQTAVSITGQAIRTLISPGFESRSAFSARFDSAISFVPLSGTDTIKQNKETQISQLMASLARRTTKSQLSESSLYTASWDDRGPIMFHFKRVDI